MEWKVARVFSSKLEGEMAVGLLKAYGIEAQLRIRDGGTLYPSTAFLAGVELLVREEELEDAVDTLDAK